MSEREPKQNSKERRKGREKKLECDNTPLCCKDCQIFFFSKGTFFEHHLHHIKLPTVTLTRLENQPHLSSAFTAPIEGHIKTAPLKITLKSTTNNSFEVVRAPSCLTDDVTAEEYFKLGEKTEDNCEIKEKNHSSLKLLLCKKGKEEKEKVEKEEEEEKEEEDKLEKKLEEEEIENFSLTLSGSDEEVATDDNEKSDVMITSSSGSELPLLPPPQCQSLDLPKIRIKIKELFQEASISPQNNNKSQSSGEGIYSPLGSEEGFRGWPSSKKSNSLNISENNKTEDCQLLSNFLNSGKNQAKDFGFSSSESEFISVERSTTSDKNCLQLHNPPNNQNIENVQNQLENITGIPMQRLAEQVSRLQPNSNSNSGTHQQQNVLINIQQFQQAPQGYQHPHQIYHPHPRMQALPSPIYSSPHYSYQPNIYYPQQDFGSNHSMPPPPLHRLPFPPLNVGGQPRPSPPAYPSPPVLQLRGKSNPSRRPKVPVNQRQKAPVVRPRLSSHPPTNNHTAVTVNANNNNTSTSTSSSSSISSNNNNNNRTIPNLVTKIVTRPTKLGVKRRLQKISEIDSIKNGMNNKREKIDMLRSDKNDDPDCQVVAVQQKCDDLPQIQSVEGGTSEPSESNVMHLSDSITLSVRKPKAVEQAKKSNATAVANLLSNKGLTVTTTPKNKEKPSTVQKNTTPPPFVSINLNNAVTIIPTVAKSGETNKKTTDSTLPTVDLTTEDESSQNNIVSSKKISNGPSQLNKCDLCPSQFASTRTLAKHHRTIHNSNVTMQQSTVGLPVIDLKNNQALQKLSSLGIYNYIPLTTPNSDKTFAVPIVSINGENNPSLCNLKELDVSSILTLGPVKTLSDIIL